MVLPTVHTKMKIKYIKNLKTKGFINKRHPSCKVYILTPILLFDNKNANSILKKYVDKLKAVEEKSVIPHNSIVSSLLKMDCISIATE